MFKILKTTENNLMTIPDVVEGAWVHVVNPTPEEFEKTYGLGIPQDFIKLPLKLDEMPRTERKAGSTLILLRSPYSGTDAEGNPIATIPLGIILCNDFIITISRHDIPLLDFNGQKSRYFSTTKRNQFILKIFSAVVNDFLSAVREISQQMDQAGLAELTGYRVKLNQLSASLKGNESVLEKLQHTTLFNPFSDDADLLNIVIAENRHATEMTAAAGSLLLEKMGALPAIVSIN